MPKTKKAPESLPKWREATDLLLERLVDLDAAGADGFEGLMRDMLVELTGLPFSLAKSGHQGGSDVRSEPSNFFNIGLEAKRYKKETSLPVDQLKAKIVEAAHSGQPIDLWILAASRPIFVTDKEALSQLADDEGIKVVVLDWDDVGTNPPVFAMALASTPKSVEAHLGKDAALTKAFSDLKGLPEFDTLVAQFRGDLCAADAGYASASRAVKKWLLDSQESNRTALARLKGHHDLLSSSTRLVERSELHSSINGWWTSDDPSLVLLGDEGTGKSWAALSWWQKIAQGESTPLTIYLPAKDVVGSDPIESIAVYLAKVTGLRDAAFWRRRLALWDRTAKPLPILLILDGLNQNWGKRDWSEFIQPMLDDSFRGRFRVLMTCWPDWWASIGALKNLRPEVKSQKVVNFTDPELNQILELHSLARSDFSAELINLMRVPRLFTLALKHRAELTKSGDITAERLAYEDWKHRLSLGSARIDWSDEEFRSFIAELGSEFGANFETTSLSTKELVDRLGRESGAEAADLRATIQDLVAGRWLEPSGTPHRYRVNKEMAPFVLGIALASQLRAVDGFENANAHLAEFVDPYRGQSLGAAVIRAAATAALLDPSVGADARKALLLRWLHEQNFGLSDFNAWWRLIGTDTELFCSLVEDQWLHPDRRGSVFEDEVFIKGFANAYEFQAVAPSIQNAITKWLGWVWPDPDEGQFIGRIDPNSARSKGNRAKVLQGIEHWAGQTDKSDWPQVTYFAEGNVSWLSHRVFGILSFIPRAPLVRAFEAWAISRSILGRQRHFEELAWVLRLNPQDEVEARSMLLDVVDRLLARSNEGTDRAAVWLLEALGDRGCLERAARIEGRLSGVDHPAAISLQAENSISPLDPTSAPDAPREGVPKGNELWQFSKSHSSADHKFERAEPILCRVDPKRIREAFVDAVKSAETRTDEQLSGLVARVRKVVILLSKEERLELAGVLRNRAENTTEASAISSECKRAAGILEMWGETALQQFAHLKSVGFEPETLEGILEALTPMLPDEASDIRALLPEAGGEGAKHVVCCYLTDADAEVAARDWSALSELVTNSNENIQNRALRVAAQGKSEQALKRFADSGWTVAGEQSRENRAYGSLALSSAADVLNDPSLLDRADPEIWGWRLKHAEGKELSANKFHAYLREQVLDIDRKGSRTYPSHAWTHKAAVKLLVEMQEKKLLDWFTPWLDEHEKLPSFAVFEPFPFNDLAWALIEAGLPEGERLWKKLVEAERHGIHKRSDLDFMPLYSPSHTDFGEYEDAMVEGLISDGKIRDFAWHALKAKRSRWLAEFIEADVKSESAFRQARGWKLLGCTDNEPVFSELWRKLKEHRPQLGWLKDVADTAEEEFNRNCWARHWYDTHIASSDVLGSYTSFQLMRLCIDGRARFWIKRSKMESAPLKKIASPYWQLNHEYLNQILKQRNKDEKDKLFGLPTMRQTQAPWF